MGRMENKTRTALRCQGYAKQVDDGTGNHTYQLNKVAIHEKRRQRRAQNSKMQRDSINQKTRARYAKQVVDGTLKQRQRYAQKSKMQKDSILQQSRARYAKQVADGTVKRRNQVQKVRINERKRTRLAKQTKGSARVGWPRS